MMFIPPGNMCQMVIVEGGGIGKDPRFKVLGCVHHPAKESRAIDDRSV